MSSDSENDWVLVGKGDPLSPVDAVFEHHHAATRTPSNSTVSPLTIPTVPDAIDGPSGFSYQQLNFARFETRFLELECSILIGTTTRWQTSAGLRGQLIHASLIRPPEYVALSYCWGDHKTTASVSVNGHERRVTTNLNVALQALRANQIARVWADAICINQGDDYERSSQVSRMGTIYSKASKVVIWLGESADGSDQAMKVLASAASRSNPAEIADDIRQATAAIVQLLSRPYWQRAWVVQEIAKGSTTEVWCGQQKLGWDMFVTGVAHCGKICEVSEGTSGLRNLHEFRQGERRSRLVESRMLLSSALIKTRYAHATDARDKVYALLALTRDGDRVVETPDYAQDPAQMFTAVSCCMIAEQGQLSLILLAGQRQSYIDVPSWLPLWYPQQQHLPPWIIDCITDDADSGRRQSYETNPVVEGSRLTVSALQLETIAVETMDYAMLELRAIPKVQDVSQTTKTLDEIVSALLSCHTGQYSLVRSDEVKRTQALVAFWTTDPTISSLALLSSWYMSHKDWVVHSRPLSFWVSEHDRLSWKQTNMWKLRTESQEFLGLLRPINDSLQLMESYDMKTTIAIRNTSPGTLRIVHKSSRDGDCIFRMGSCSLPVILRPVFGQDRSYKFIAEAIGRRSVNEKHWHSGMSWKDRTAKGWQLITVR
ncbi:hypothetical protein DOTSEDRAFT_72834 [Dothistroma septosporum NZE10]|uniref:Heterokaryon incompatibility domain-containing protein n=1 Tax=Dothistroma septosporum (strain NZE10 / CBS 128990) TaxID=675120 RepID=M2WNK9_DOTSN|nr:hypothetical protein DOTSEDRAFT_72834 [Dothistroma septosporum NZE10]